MAGRALLLAGPPGTGKTVSDLVKEEFLVLSKLLFDEIFLKTIFFKGNCKRNL